MHLTTSNRIPKLRRTLALPFIVATIAMISIVGAIPAVAAPNTIYTNPAAGNARFAAYGDHVLLCDESEDSHSVAVYVEYVNEKNYKVTDWRWNWEGPYKHGGCKDINLKVKEYTNFKFKVCLGNHGHPGGTEAKTIKGSCSALTTVYNNG